MGVDPIGELSVGILGWPLILGIKTGKIITGRQWDETQTIPQDAAQRTNQHINMVRVFNIVTYGQMGPLYIICQRASLMWVLLG